MKLEKKKATNTKKKSDLTKEKYTKNEKPQFRCLQNPKKRQTSIPQNTNHRSN